jgi:hypothetical protein
MELRAPMAPEVSARRLLRGALLELKEAERLVADLEAEAPDPTRCALLMAIRDAVGILEKFITPLPQI